MDICRVQWSLGTPGQHPGTFLSAEKPGAIVALLLKLVMSNTGDIA